MYANIIVSTNYLFFNFSDAKQKTADLNISNKLVHLLVSMKNTASAKES